MIIITNKVFLFGLDAAGKTSIVKKIKEEPEPDKTSPTLGFNLDQLIIKDTEFIVWEGGGQITYRKRWSRGVLDSNILLFVLDTSENSRYDEAKKELETVLSDMETRDVPLIIAFHKMDLDISKKNLSTARGMFQPDLFDDRPIYRIETSIYDPETIIKLKDTLVEIIEKSRW